MSGSPFSEEIHDQQRRLWNVKDYLQPLPMTKIMEINQKHKRPFNVAVININGDLNLGMIMRTGAIYGAKKCIYFGRKKHDARSCVGSQFYIEKIYSEEISAENFRKTMEANNLIPYFVEQGGIQLPEISWNEIRNKLPEDKEICFVFGSEGTGIPSEILNTRRHFGTEIITIPQLGIMRSLNVAVSAGILIWEYSKDSFKLL